MEEEKKAKEIDLFQDEKYKELVNNRGLSTNNLLIPSVYKEIFLDNYRYFILSSGRPDMTPYRLLREALLQWPR